jgi:16S rRNA pseudouridine516 synthase
MEPGKTKAPKRRLDQLLSACGYCSRGESRGWIKAGRVTVNGERPDSQGEKVHPDEVRVDGAPVDCPDGVLAVLNKPFGYVCSRDEREGPNIYELLPPLWSQRNPPVTTVGRLDKDTTGVLLITDQGDLVHRWTSPKYKLPRLYEVTVGGELRPELVPLFASGTLLLPDEEKPCLPARLEIVGPFEARLELTEGRFHQVRRMFANVGLMVTRLHRSRFGDVTVEELAPGEWRLLPLPAG